MEKIHENMCKQACYVFIQNNYIKAHVLRYFFQLVLIFTPPLHCIGKGSIVFIQFYAAKQLESIVQTLRGKPLYLDMRDLKYLFSRVPLTIPHLADMVSSWE